VTIWLWALGALAPFGIGAPILFGVAGHQARKRSWQIAAVAYGVLSWGGILVAVVSADDSTGSTLGGFMILAAWIGGAAHAFAIRGEYTRRVGSASQRALERARAAVAERREARRLAVEEPEVAVQMGVGRPDVRGARHMHVVDVNRADADALTRLPEVDEALAREIIRAREEIDGFESVDDLGTVLHLDGDKVEDLRPYVVFLPR
jgi:DNA uptake protein ComE-like DNA-binding protein